MRRFSTHVRAFVVVHDELPAFHAASIALTLIAAALLNVGAFAVLIAAHASLDLVKYRDVHGMRWSRTLVATLRESLLDLFFLALAVCFALYLHHGESVFALSTVARLEEVLLRVFGIGLARLEVLLHGIWVFSDVRHHLTDVRDASGTWRRSEILAVCGLAAALAFIAASPLVMQPGAIGQVFSKELVPWRM